MLEKQIKPFILEREKYFAHAQIFLKKEKLRCVTDEIVIKFVTIYFRIDCNAHLTQFACL